MSKFILSSVYILNVWCIIYKPSVGRARENHEMSLQRYQIIHQRLDSATSRIQIHLVHKPLHHDVS
jgi:hypothetical protein